MSIPETHTHDVTMAGAIKIGDVRVVLSDTKPTGHLIWKSYAAKTPVPVYVKWGRWGEEFVFFYATEIVGDEGDADFIATLNTHADGSGYGLTVAYEANCPTETDDVTVPQ